MNFKEWLLLTEAKKSSDIARELLGNNETLFNKIKSDIPKDIKPDLQAKLLPIAAYYYKQQPNTETLKQDIKDYAELVKLNKMQIITVNDDLTISNEFKNYLHWTEVIHGKQAEDKILNAPIPQGDLEDQELIKESPDGRIKVYKANSVNQCIILGKGESFCISQPANTMFQTYRDTKVSTFYFVYDNTRTDDLAIVVVDATEHGIELTDRKNQTAITMQDPYSKTPKRIESDPQLYFKYLKEHGIDTSIFVNIPKNKEEEAEQQKLGEQKRDLQWFKSLTLEEKSKYIGRGHELSNEQFDYLYDNKFMLLLTQYVRTGRKVNDYQLEKVAKVRDLRDKYLHNRLIANQNDENFSKQEYELLSPKQKEEFFNVDAHKKLQKAIRIGELEKLKEAIKDGAETDYYTVANLAKNGHLDIIKYLLGDEIKDEKGIKLPDKIKLAYISDDAVRNAARNGHLDIVKYLVEKGAKISDDAVGYAAESGNFDIVKYLVEKGAYVGDTVSGAASSGHLDIIKYLLGDEIKDEKGNIVKLPDKIEPAYISDDAVRNAAYNGHLDIVKYLVEEKGVKIRDYFVEKAAYAGNFDIVKYLLGDEIKDEKGNIIKLPDKIKPANISDFAVFYAAQNGHLDIVKHLVEKGAKISDDAVHYAAVKGHYDIVKYLVEKGAKIYDDVVAYLAKKGHLDVVKYLLGDETKDEKGNIIKLPDKIKPANISDDAVSNAVFSGHLDIVKYLVEKGAKINNFAVYDAAYAGNFDIVKYLVEKGAYVVNAVSGAASSGHLDIIKYLLGDEIKDEKGNIIKLPNKVKPANIDDAVYYAARNGHLDVIKYLVEEKGAYVGDHAFYSAKTQEIKDYLVQKQKEQQLNNT